MNPDLYPDDVSDLDYEAGPANMPPGDAEALERASWHLSMSARYQHERDQLTAVFTDEIERLQLRLAERQRTLDARIAWHEEPVRAFHLARLGRDPKSSKTLSLPYGTSRIRVSKTPHVEIVDRPALLVWAEANHPEILGRTINVTGVKSITASLNGINVIDSNGERVPGVDAALPDPSWSVSYDSGVLSYESEVQ